MTDLKPCPFCGGDAEPVSSQVAEDGTETWVYCKHCGARTEGIEAAYSEHEAAAIEWNERPLFQVERERVDDLETALRLANIALDNSLKELKATND